MFSNRNTTVLVALAALAVLAVTLGAAGTVAADTEADNSTIEVTNATTGAYADVTAVPLYSGSPAPNVTVTVEGLPNGTDVGNGTVLMSETRTLQSGSIESYEYQITDSDRANYTRAHISVSSTGDGSLIDSVDIGSIKRVSAGGGGGLGGLGGGIGTTGAIAAVVLALFVYTRDN
ncbi:hypothetical protein [Halorubrum ezzemoulense]|uniref:hypothetical protein n=1 Tax=Halorubrum ezzemoulense TaxID=337243 RepID=UPI0023310400|nr:hypothetical protein [Halorubrum ezzemoulense]MDB2239664.1 hypothetical protein [Halorubrum ezzemoulense]